VLDGLATDAQIVEEVQFSAIPKVKLPLDRPDFLMDSLDQLTRGCRRGQRQRTAEALRQRCLGPRAADRVHALLGHEADVSGPSFWHAVCCQ
jgi:hypothetical protein